MTREKAAQKAMEAIQWLNNDSGTIDFCFWCFVNDGQPHEADCLFYDWEDAMDNTSGGPGRKGTTS